MYAAMAQLVEHILGKDEVPGPNPGSSSRQPRREIFGALAFYRLLQDICGSFFVIWGCLVLVSRFRSGSVPKAQIRSAYPTQRSASLFARRRVRVSSLIANTRVAASDILAAARSRSGSDSSPNCHSIPSRRFATRCGSVTFGGKQHSVVFMHPQAASLPRREIFGALAFYRDFAVLLWEYFFYFTGLSGAGITILTGLCA